MAWGTPITAPMQCNRLFNQINYLAEPNFSDRPAGGGECMVTPC